MNDDIEKWKDKGFEFKNGKLTPTSNENESKPYNKYRNQKVEIDGITFDSIKEGKEYGRLKLLKSAGEIKDFWMQVPFVVKINGQKITTYKLDFKIEHKDGTFDYVDIKGKDKITGKYITTQVFKLKKKMVEATFDIKITLK